MRDGGGFCSPGRWPPEKRRRPACAATLTNLIHEALSNSTKEQNDRVAICLIKRKFKESPFKELGAGIRRSLEAILDEEGFPRKSEKKPGVMDFDLIERVARWTGDPDYQAPAECVVGVKIGYKEPLARCAFLWPSKQKWRLEEDDSIDPSMINENYSSAKVHKDVLTAQIAEQIKLGFMIETSYSEAAKKYGDRLRIAPMAMVPEGDDFRMIHDATHKVLINHSIRVPDHELYPTPADVRTAMTYDENAVPYPIKRYLCMKSDVSKAHRRIPVHEADWGLQGCAVDIPADPYSKDWPILLNVVGTYGVGSASWWWGRIGSLLLRFIYYFTGIRWAFRFADDYHFLSCAGGDGPLCPFLQIFILLEILQVPLKWSKTSGGTEVEWIGFFFDYTKLEHGLSEHRAAWLMKWLERVAADGVVVLRDLRGTIGRLTFAGAILRHIKAFLAPLYAWSSVGDDSAAHSVPLAIRLVLLWISSLIAKRRVVSMRPTIKHIGELFRADAKAQGMLVVIGGWELTPGHDEPTERSRWFSVELNPESAPWAFSKGLPYKTIAALELFGTLLSVMCFGCLASRSGRTGSISFSAGTDNQSNQGATRKGLSTRYPLCLIMMELSSQLEAQDLELDLRWRNREDNGPADDLTNGEFSKFNPAMRIEIDVRNFPWLVLPWLTKEAGQMYEMIAAAKAAAKVEPPVPKGNKKRKVTSLRQSDPW